MVKPSDRLNLTTKTVSVVCLRGMHERYFLLNSCNHFYIEVREPTNNVKPRLPELRSLSI